MKKAVRKILFKTGILLAALFFAAVLTLPAVAEVRTGDSDWSVTFTEDGEELASNFSDEEFRDVFDKMQPGDAAEITLTLRNQNTNTVNWYMDNDVLTTLEESSGDAGTGGGVYTYRLIYTSPDGEERFLISSGSVGGAYTDGRDKADMGLKEITRGYMTDYDANNVNPQGDAFFYLDEYKTGDEGKLLLYVKLDGETQGNFYQDTLAQMEMKFAVELPEEEITSEPESPSFPWHPFRHRRHPRPQETAQNPERTAENEVPLIAPVKGGRVVSTGDNSQPGLFTVLTGISGLALILLGLTGFRRHKKAVMKALGLLMLGTLTAQLFGGGPVSTQAASAEDTYLYTVRVFGGEKGTVYGDSVYVVDGFAPGTRFTLDYLDTDIIKVNEKEDPDDPDYRPIGLRLSGRDNLEELNPSFIVTADLDIVVAYGVAGTTARYTIRYLDLPGNELLPSRSYMGSDGEIIVVPYKEIEGYIPNAYNLRGTLDKDEETVFVFTYTPVTEPETPEGDNTADQTGQDQAVEDDNAADQNAAAQNANDETDAAANAGTEAAAQTADIQTSGVQMTAGTENSAAATAGDAVNNGQNQGTGSGAAGEGIPEVLDIDEGGVPLAGNSGQDDLNIPSETPGSSIGGNEGSSAEQNGSGLFTRTETAIAAGCAALILLLCLILLIMRKLRSEKE